MSDLARVLEAVRVAAGHDLAVLVRDPDASGPRLEAATAEAPAVPVEILAFAVGDLRARAETDGRSSLIVAIPGSRDAWLVVSPAPGVSDSAACLELALPVVSQFLQSALEVEHAANELAERYEEINLLYTISEILGRTVSMEEAARTILEEVSETVGARRGAILVHDRAAGMLRAVAVLGAEPRDVPTIDIDSPTAVSTRVFLTQRAALIEAHEPGDDAERHYRRGPMLSVPIMWTAPPPADAEPLGVVNLSDRRSGLAFSAGDQKLMSAIATQIGTAIQNARLVRASVEQQRLAQEMQLAHDLQMKLLPSGSVVAPDARVDARVVPAESVGGDFYNLFRLGHGCTGVMIGDVSGHGYHAALIMALAMSASAIHAQRTADPGELLHALFTSLREELTTTEMHISAFYGVVDVDRGELRYANTGHPHAFVVSGEGALERLAAQDPPIGIGERQPATVHRSWNRETDTLVLFTDGISDARNRAGKRIGEERILEAIVRSRAGEPAQIVNRVFDAVHAHAGPARKRDDLTIVVLKS
jgi:sigma-B regulation protein RsbU (phosphoserine phosphatase)